MKKAALLSSIGLLVTGSFLPGQSSAPAPAAAPPPVANTRARLFTLEELEAIPLVPPRSGKSVTKALFDGKTLDGWQGNPDWWSVKDGAIVGKFGARVPTTFLYTKDHYSDFRLTLMSRMVESDNHAGVAFWGEIVERPDNKFYTRGPLVIFPNPSMWDYNAAAGLRVYKPTLEKVTSQFDWIKVEILAQGNRVRSAFNGVQVMEWREADLSRIKEGPIGMQLHAWKGPQEVLYKNIVVETFPKENKLLTVKR
jgi:hypothetical protein